MHPPPLPNEIASQSQSPEHFSNDIKQSVIAPPPIPQHFQAQETSLTNDNTLISDQYQSEYKNKQETLTPKPELNSIAGDNFNNEICYSNTSRISYSDEDISKLKKSNEKIFEYWKKCLTTSSSSSPNSYIALNPSLRTHFNSYYKYICSLNFHLQFAQVIYENTFNKFQKPFEKYINSSQKAFYKNNLKTKGNKNENKLNKTQMRAYVVGINTKTHKSGCCIGSGNVSDAVTNVNSSVLKDGLATSSATEYNFSLNTNGKCKNTKEFNENIVEVEEEHRKSKSEGSKNQLQTLSLFDVMFRMIKCFNQLEKEFLEDLKQLIETIKPIANTYQNTFQEIYKREKAETIKIVNLTQKILKYRQKAVSSIQEHRRRISDLKNLEAKIKRAEEQEKISDKKQLANKKQIFKHKKIAVEASDTAVANCRLYSDTLHEFNVLFKHYSKKIVPEICEDLRKNELICRKTILDFCQRFVQTFKISKFNKQKSQINRLTQLVSELHVNSEVETDIILTMKKFGEFLPKDYSISYDLPLTIEEICQSKYVEIKK